MKINPRDRTAAAATIDETDPAAIREAALVRASLYQLVGRPPERLHTINVARYALAGKYAHSYPQIEASLGLKGKRVRQLHTEALGWLRHPARSQRLRAQLERHTVATDHSIERKLMQ